MKKLVTLFVPCLLLAAAGCTNEDNPNLGQGEGAIALHLNLDGNVTDAVPATRASQATVVPEASDLSLSLTKNDGSYSKTWNSAADFPADQGFATGAYSMKAFWGNPTEEGFEKPYYEGTADLLVEEGGTTEVNLTATLANTMVSIAYTEAFRNYFSQYSSQLHSEGGDFITFISDEERPAYLRPGKVTVTLSITKLNGVSATIQPAEFEALARHHYHITLDVNSGETGEAQLAVVFDDSIVSEDVTVDLSDDILSAPEPVVNASGFTPGTTFETMELSAPSEPLRMTVAAAGGLRSATLTTQSELLLSKGFPAEIDLMSANPSQQALLKTLGLDVKGLWQNPDKMAVLDFSDIFKNLSGEGTHSFTLVVKDKIGKVNLPVTLTAKTSSVSLSLKTVPSVYIDATQASATITTDAPDPTGALSVEVYNFGTWSEAKLISAAPAASARHRAPGVSKDYTLTFNIPADPADMQMRVKFKGQVKATGNIAKHGAILSLESENHVFGSTATFKVTHNPNVPLSSLNYFAAPGNGSFAATNNVTLDAANDRVTFKGLTPGTAYSVKADEGTDASTALAPCKFTTETALQLPNASFEDWCVTETGAHWELRYPAATAESCVWGTNNYMTTHPVYPTAIKNGYAYDCISGTKPVTGRSSGQAACISTQGWGPQNSALFGVNGVCDFIDPGLLHLGDTRNARPAGYTGRSGPLNTDDLNCGYAFASRPSAVQFWFKYEAKNSADHGVAIAKVYDSLGREIASGQLELGSQSAWTQKSIPLTYAFGAPKAAKIYVCFMSTNVADALTKNSSWLNGPGFANTSRGEYSGSRLYIDDINLSY